MTYTGILLVTMLIFISGAFYDSRVYSVNAAYNGTEFANISLRTTQSGIRTLHLLCLPYIFIRLNLDTISLLTFYKLGRFKSFFVTH